jgi:predicted XRE-type DNA-binding protein
MKRKKPTKIEFEKSSGNIYADLGLEDSECSKIGLLVFKLFMDKKLKQCEIANLLQIAQTRPLRMVPFSGFAP